MTAVAAAVGSGTATAAAASAVRRRRRAGGARRRRAGARRRHRRRAGFLRVHPDVRLPGRAQRRLRLAVPGPQERSAPWRRGHRRDPGAARGRAAQQRQKFNPLVRLDTINGLDPELSRNRPEFTKLTPLYPNERLRLETESHILTTRVIDLVMPVGKGQRALIVSPPEGRQDDGHAGHRQRHHHEQPRSPPHGRAGRRAARRGHRHAAVGEGRGHRLHLRPSAEPTTPWSPSCPSSGRSGWSRWAATSSCCSTRSPGWAAPTTWPPRPPGGSCPVVSTRRRCSRPSGSSVPPATSRTVAR